MAARRPFPGLSPIVPYKGQFDTVSNPREVTDKRIEAMSEEKKKEEAEKNRPRGRATTLFTSPQGLLGAPGITRRTLIGF